MKNARTGDDLLSEIHNTVKLLELAWTQFEYQSDHDLVDASIFDIKSLTSRHQYLIKLAKEWNVCSDTIGECWLPNYNISHKRKGAKRVC